VGQPIRIDIPRHSLWQARLEKVIPRASLEPEYPAMTTINGGSLAVKPVENNSGETEAFEFLSPRFTAIVTLSPTISGQLHAGQLGSVSYRPCSDSFIVHFYNTASRWIHTRLSVQG
jgi:hypothetical protein